MSINSHKLITCFSFEQVLVIKYCGVKLDNSQGMSEKIEICKKKLYASQKIKKIRMFSILTFIYDTNFMNRQFILLSKIIFIIKSFSAWPFAAVKFLVS